MTARFRQLLSEAARRLDPNDTWLWLWPIGLFAAVWSVVMIVLL